ncbi:MAG: UDP-N-acetylmuramoyl-tripeptide--D-alanyl-D-alanine ligase [Odoribacteraceae bacterium]|jgi:UDP-N-acetylmuramoyl-tripeptide--D-alanyl-D-alanine ligase|nr:UDP-N-acetylmuramoyl-tripeptide--D-alanyl-D-alanine ligase [Odoribacteraceae bacterium]
MATFRREKTIDGENDILSSGRRFFPVFRYLRGLKNMVNAIIGTISRIMDIEKKIEHVYAVFREGGKVVIDSREVKEGDIFVAIQGEHRDGNLFAGQAIQQGARCVVVSETAGAGERRVVVPDTLLFLQQLARYHRRRLAIPLLGITGTNGKTTTKELCQAVLSRKCNTVATRGNLNNHLGVPLTLLSMDASTRFGIVEMGANHPGEIAALCAIAEPDYGLITNIGQAHLEGFGCRENIIRAKNELYDFVRARGGLLFVNARDELLVRLARGIPAVRYTGEVKQLYPYLTCDAELPAGHLYIRTRLTGGYNLDNVMAAVAVGLYFGVDPLLVRDAIEAYVPSNLRSQLVRGLRNTIVLDAYNANPDSMRAAISHFAGMPGENKLLVLGEMLELGDHSPGEHAGLLEWIAGECPSPLWLVGRSFEKPASDYPLARWFPDTGALVEFLRREPLSSSLILVKGSRGNRLEQIVEYL